MSLCLWSCARSTTGRRHASSGISCRKFLSGLCSPTVFFLEFQMISYQTVLQLFIAAQTAAYIKQHLVKQSFNCSLQPKVKPKLHVRKRFLMGFLCAFVFLWLCLCMKKQFLR